MDEKYKVIAIDDRYLQSIKTCCEYCGSDIVGEIETTMSLYKASVMDDDYEITEACKHLTSKGMDFSIMSFNEAFKKEFGDE